MLKQTRLRTFAFVSSNQVGESSDPYVGLVRRVGHEVQRLVVITKDDGEGTFFRELGRRLTLAECLGILSNSDLLD